MKIRSYSELRTLDTLEDRYEYLKLMGSVGRDTFGFERYLNQQFYTSREWKQARRDTIARDYGLNLGIEGQEIFGKIIVHHMNPMLPADIIDSNDMILNPEFLISTDHNTHNAIHYGDVSLLPQKLIERRPGDTKLW